MCHDQADFELMEPFDIDHGELDGIDARTVFCLGYEFCQVRNELDAGRGFSRPLHFENRGRIERMCLRRGRTYLFGDEADGWVPLTVEGM